MLSLCSWCFLSPYVRKQFSVHRGVSPRCNSGRGFPPSNTSKPLPIFQGQLTSGVSPRCRIVRLLTVLLIVRKSAADLIRHYQLSFEFQRSISSAEKDSVLGGGAYYPPAWHLIHGSFHSSPPPLEGLAFYHFQIHECDSSVRC